MTSLHRIAAFLSACAAPVLHASPVTAAGDAAPKSTSSVQAFSTDDGKTWETNWVMDFSRIQENAK